MMGVGITICGFLDLDDQHGLYSLLCSNTRNTAIKLYTISSVNNPMLTSQTRNFDFQVSNFYSSMPFFNMDLSLNPFS